MEIPVITNNPYLNSWSNPASGVQQNGGSGFRSALDASMSLDRMSSNGLPADSAQFGFKGEIISADSFEMPQSAGPTSLKDAVSAYAQQTVTGKASSQMSGWEKYKDDQLLRNPGGDHYYLDENRVSDDPKDRESFFDRVGKDLSDVWGNIKNFFGNLFMESTIKYRDENDQIKEGAQRGLVGTVVDFFKNVGSALSFGLWHPDEEKEPEGFVERISHFGSKLKQAFLSDLVEGIPQSVNHMGKNVLLAGLNLVQVVPDATIGNFDEGRKLTTTVFDNGQVLVEYLTDIVPSGDAWFRVHASNLSDFQVPFLYNLGMPENFKGDVRWQYVRNTPFRKTIETIGTLLADIAAIGIAGQTGISTNQGNQK